MAQFDTSKLNFDSDASQNVERGNFQWKDETQEEVIFVPNKNGRFLIQIRQ